MQLEELEFDTRTLSSMELKADGSIDLKVRLMSWEYNFKWPFDEFIVDL